jgi:hypothetical protein
MRHMYKVIKKKINQQHIFIKMGNLAALLPNATPLVQRFCGEMSNKRQF